MAKDLLAALERSLHSIRWTARAGHRAHWRCTCGEWCTTSSRSGSALDAAEIMARAHIETPEPTP